MKNLPFFTILTTIGFDALSRTPYELDDPAIIVDVSGQMLYAGVSTMVLELSYDYVVNLVVDSWGGF